MIFRFVEFSGHLSWYISAAHLKAKPLLSKLLEMLSPTPEAIKKRVLCSRGDFNSVFINPMFRVVWALHSWIAPVISEAKLTVLCLHENPKNRCAKCIVNLFSTACSLYIHIESFRSPAGEPMQFVIHVISSNKLFTDSFFITRWPTRPAATSIPVTFDPAIESSSLTSLSSSHLSLVRKREYKLQRRYQRHAHSTGWRARDPVRQICSCYLAFRFKFT